MKRRMPIVVGLAVGLTLAQAAALNEAPELAANGWHSWRVTAVDGAPSWCCGSWNRGVATPTSCNLDDHDNHFDDDYRFDGSPAEMQVYVKTENDLVHDLRVYDSRCPVESLAPVADLGLVASDASIGWLEQQISTNPPMTSRSLMALASHDGQRASRSLERLAQDGPSKKTREQALFWIGQLRMADSGKILIDVLENDESAAIREHAIFAYSQSAASDRLAVLTRAGRSDSSPDVRGQAWFWLAQSGLDGAEAEIMRAVANDLNKDARHKAVFALAQLPDEGTSALLQVLGDRKLPRDSREQALFWLVQSDSVEAWAYLDELLTR